MKNICVVIGSRANYSSIKSAMTAINNNSKLTLQVVATASSLLDRYGSVVDLIRNDGFEINEEIFTLLEGENPLTMAKTTGLGLIELTTVFNRLKPNFVLTVGDRFETMATTLAAAYMNIPLVHTMGGEVTGTIDESIRHAITKFAHIHFPASIDAYDRIIKLGENPDNVFMVGCPRIDLVAEILQSDPGALNIEPDLFLGGVGEKLDLTNDFVLVSQHPVTTEYGEGENQIFSTLNAVNNLNIQAIVLWPNSDAGSEDIAKGIRKWREKNIGKKMHFFKNLPINTYVRLMKRTKCLVGNSSSGIREGAFIGTPCVNIGTRQNRRERGMNVIDVENNEAEIEKAISKQIEHGIYPMDPIYGTGNAGLQISEVLSNFNNVNIQKIITY
jgi:UDP-hydrolysing UDP-N-acetyl-D-glucosamine 2-epimerase